MLDPNAIQLVPATEDDYEFAFQAKRLAQGAHITERWGWDEAKQRAYHLKDWDERRPDIILNEGKPIGTLLVVEEPDYIEIRQFFIVPEFQNQGIGTHLLRRVLERADAKSVPVRLAILLGSPVKSLYLRHGFQVVRTEESFCFMERPAAEQP